MDQLLTAEAIVSVCGVSRVLADKPKSPTEAELSKASKIEEAIKSRAREVLAMTKASAQMGPPTLPDYRDTHKRLTSKINGDDFAEMLLTVPADIQPACAAVWSNAVNYLDSILPKRVEETMTGPKLRDASKGEMAEFGWAWRVANQHLIVLDLLSDGMLIGAEVNHAQAMFPQLHALMCGEIQNALAYMAAEKGEDWQPPWWLQKQICTLLGVSPVSKTLLNDIEGAIQASQKQAQQRTNDIKTSANLATPTQRIEAK
jgi:hypothetical protein